MKVRYGTRGSALALAQSDEVAVRLREIHPSLELERVVIRTSGDRLTQKTFEEPAVLGTSAEGVQGSSLPPETDNVKAMFVKEIEEALLNGTVDFAVHSAKDLPGDIADGLKIAAFPPREDPRDVFIGGPNAPHWEDLPIGAVIGTASLRRQIQLKLTHPDITFVAMRGNVDTRLKQLKEGKVTALILAKAGLKRLNRDQIPHQLLPVEVMIPAPGQGALAVQARSDRKDVVELLSRLDDPKTRIEVECERLFLKAMGGGCRTPLGAYAQAEMPAEKNAMASVKLSIFWSDLQGINPIRRSGVCAASPDRMAAFIQDIAEQIRKTSDEIG